MEQIGFIRVEDLAA